MPLNEQGSTPSTTQELTLSVVVPLYNSAAYIVQTLRSLEAQSSPLEQVVVVDDGSTDDGPRLVREFAQLSQLDVLLVSTPNRGVAMARNTGVSHTSTVWVALLDADDLWHIDRARALRWAMAAHPAAVAVATEAQGFAREQDRTAVEGHSRGVMVQQWGDDAVTLSASAVVPEGSMPVRLVTATDLLANIQFVSSNVCYRRDTYLAAGGCAPWLPLVDDYPPSVVAAQQYPIVTVDLPLLLYRVRPGSLSHDADAAIAPAYLAAFAAARAGGLVPWDRPPPWPQQAHYRHFARVLAASGRRQESLGFTVLGAPDLLSGLRAIVSAVRPRPELSVGGPVARTLRRLRGRRGRRRDG